MKIPVIKAVRIDGKVYASPKFAAERWIEMKLRERWIKSRNQKTWQRLNSESVHKRYLKMVLPVFEKLLS